MGLKRPTRNTEPSEAVPPVTKPVTKATVKKSAPPPAVKKTAKAAADKPATTKPAGTGRASMIKIKNDNAYALAFSQNMRSAAGHNQVMPRDRSLYTNMVLPIPLILQCVIETNGIPFTSVMEIVGDKGSNKTALLLELANFVNGRYHASSDYAGFMDYMSAETKHPDKMILAMCGYPDEEIELRPTAMRAVNPFICPSMDEWQRTALRRAKAYRKLVDPKRCIPYILGIDSFTAKLMEETSDKIERDGIPGRQHSFEAQAIKKWAITYCKEMNHYPTIIAGINHVARDRQPNTMELTRHKPGGRYLNYLETLDFDVKKLGKTLVTKPNFETPVPSVQTNKIMIKAEKNSLGMSGKKCITYVRWYYTMPEAHHINPDSPRQRMHWLWGRALVEHLDVTADTCTLDEHGKDQLRSICHVVCKNKSASIYSCRQVPESKNGMPAEELGRIIETDPKLRLAIQQFHGVTLYDEFRPFTNYKELMNIQDIKKAKEDADD